jgi:DNA repair protein RadC
MHIATAEDAAKLLAPYFEKTDVERVVAMHLTAEQQFVGLTFEATGGEEDVELPVRAIAASALRLGAACVVVAHNHPSGRVEPSPADLVATRQLAETLSSIDVRLVDHLIFAGEDTRSFRALGLL